MKFANEKLRLPAEDNAEISVAEYIIREIQNDNLEFKNLIYKKIFEEISLKIEKGEKIEEKTFIYSEDRKISELAVEIFTSRYEISNVWKRKDTYIELPGENLGTEVPKTVLAYKNKIIMIALSELYAKIKDANADTDSDKIKDIQKQVMNLNEIKRIISKDLGERIVISFYAGVQARN